MRNSCFNPRARVGRDPILTPQKLYDLSFNPRARVGRDQSPTLYSRGGSVSIHAPAWGATKYHPKVPINWVTFQSTRPRGARLYDLPIEEAFDSFNPRARVGRDGRMRERLRRACGVSIHAPAWGATKNSLGAHRKRTCFNPRARVGRDYIPHNVNTF